MRPEASRFEAAELRRPGRLLAGAKVLYDARRGGRRFPIVFRQPEQIMQPPPDIAPFFWLHIKKSAGITTRKLLKPYYIEVDRIRNPPNFIQSDPSCWNDVLNNFRIVLGEYQFRRALFAKRFLYRDRWNDLVSFAFSRDPTGRCVSAFHYLWYPKDRRQIFKRHLSLSWRHRRPVVSVDKAFDHFLGMIEETRHSDSMFEPYGLHFSTHVAAMWDDVTDENGNVLLSRIYRLENLHDGIDEVFEMCGLPRKVDRSSARENVSARADLNVKRHQKARIEKLYAKDFEIYESLAQ